MLTSKSIYLQMPRACILISATGLFYDRVYKKFNPCKVHLYYLYNVFILLFDCFAEKLLEESEWSMMHPLFLFHFLFYFLITIGDDGKKQLRDSGVIKLIIKELWMIQLFPTWHKVSKMVTRK